MRKFDAIIIGSGPNGLAAAITFQQQGLSTLLIEGADTIGGGMRTKELTIPGFKHDVCSAIHPMAMASPFFRVYLWKHLGYLLLSLSMQRHTHWTKGKREFSTIVLPKR